MSLLLPKDAMALKRRATALSDRRSVLSTCQPRSRATKEAKPTPAPTSKNRLGGLLIALLKVALKTSSSHLREFPFYPTVTNNSKGQSVWLQSVEPHSTVWKLQHVQPLNCMSQSITSRPQEASTGLWRDILGPLIPGPLIPGYKTNF